MRGLYRKFIVTRRDGRDGPGEKHEHCTYFVLDMEHDPHAVPALAAYAKSCEEAYPQLSKDLQSIVEGNQLMKQKAAL